MLEKHTEPFSNYNQIGGGEDIWSAFEYPAGNQCHLIISSATTFSSFFLFFPFFFWSLNCPDFLPYKLATDWEDVCLISFPLLAVFYSVRWMRISFESIFSKEDRMLEKFHGQGVVFLHLFKDKEKKYSISRYRPLSSNSEPPPAFQG